MKISDLTEEQLNKVTPLMAQYIESKKNIMIVFYYIELEIFTNYFLKMRKLLLKFVN